MKKRTQILILSLALAFVIGACEQNDNGGETINPMEDTMTAVETDSDVQTDEEDKITMFVNRHGEYFDNGNDSAGVGDTLIALQWIAPRGGEPAAWDVSAEDNVYIAESENALNGMEDLEDHIWIRIVQMPVIPNPGSSIPYKDFLFYRENGDAFVGIQSPENEDVWSVYKMTGYGDWLEKEIDIYLRMITGL